MNTATPFPPTQIHREKPRARQVSTAPFITRTGSAARGHPLAGVEHIHAAFLAGRLESHTDFALLLEVLRRREAQIVPLADALFATLGFEPAHPWRQCAVALAHRALLDQEDRVAYHNHRHVFEVTCCFWQFGTAGADGLGRTDLALGVLAALAHDLDFDQLTARQPGAAESHSADLAEAIMLPHLAQNDRAAVVELVMATAPDRHDALRARYQNLGAPRDDSQEDRLMRTAALLVRADLTPSTALNERYNSSMSHLLRCETGLAFFDQPEARLQFVKSRPPFTLSERVRGFDDASAGLAADLQRGIQASKPPTP